VRGLEQIVEIHPLRRAGDAHAPSLPLPAPGAIPRRRLAGLVAIGEHNHVARIARQIESAKARGRARGPCRISRRLHRGEAGLDAFADHQHVAEISEAHHAAATRPEHHLRGIDWRLSVPVAGEEGAVNGDPFRISAARYERHQ
jgi:hypothetical protein